MMWERNGFSFKAPYAKATARRTGHASQDDSPRGVDHASWYDFERSNGCFGNTLRASSNCIGAIGPIQDRPQRCVGRGAIECHWT